MGKGNNPCAAGKTVSGSCRVGMIIETVKSGALVSVKAHYVQLIAQSVSTLSVVGWLGSDTLFFFLILVILV